MSLNDMGKSMNVQCSYRFRFLVKEIFLLNTDAKICVNYMKFQALSEHPKRDNQRFRKKETILLQFKRQIKKKSIANATV